ncbi:type VI secretion system tip protein TssI/VgrG [Sorangium sp. So ce429]
MTSITLHLGDPSLDVSVRSAFGNERLGVPPRYELELISPELVEIPAVLGKPCALRLSNDHGDRWIAGLITRFVRIATAQASPARRYRAVVEPPWALLRLRRQARVYQHLTVPDLIREVLLQAGFPAESIDRHLAGTYAARDYVVQWLEDDLSFIRRLCEDEGLYFRAATTPDGAPRFLLEDSSPLAPSFDGILPMVDDAGLARPGPVASSPRLRTERRAGKVTLRDHNPARPAAQLEASAIAGAPVETDTEVYLAPGRFRSPSEGAARARLRLESLRAGAKLLSFETDALGLTPGQTVSIEHAGDYSCAPWVEGGYFIVSVALRHTPESSAPSLLVEAIPKDVPFRLPRSTPCPRIRGVQPAVVTGPPGSEIHTDDAGRISVRFFWDRSGPTDHTSSLLVRVVQPNTPGSMIIPRVGWEVAVAFEDGDPDRPYVLGRVYNAKTPPPVALPANKTMTVLRTFSSPGGARHNTISFDDAAGRQNVSIHAGFGRSTSVGNNMMVQTAKVETQSIKNQTVTVGVNDALTIKESLIAQVGSQTSTVGSSQSIYVKGNFDASVGTESVAIGGALLEKIGDPVKGALNLGVNAALAGAAARGQRLGRTGQTATAVATAAAGIGWGMFQAESAPGAGPHAARDAGLLGLVGVAASRVPGGDALFSALAGGGRALPWQAPPQAGGPAEAGGGARGAASDAASAQGAGPGHRNEVIQGPYAEIIGGAHVVTTPGNIAWQTTGGCAITVGGAHSTKAVSVGARTLGASEETLGSLHIDTKTHIGREVKGPVTTNVAGSLKVKAGGMYSMNAGSKITVQAGGALKCDGGVVTFVVGDSVVSASSGGVLVKATTIKIDGATKQSGDTTH